MSKDYYKILGLEKGASAEEIKKAFRKKAHEHHPDKAGGDEAKFKEVNEAYQVLSDSKKKAQYDQFGSGFEQAGAGFGGFNGFGGFANGGGVHVDMDDLGDLFGGIGDIFGFGGGQRESRRHKGNDLRIMIEITFLEAVFGVEKTVKIGKKIVCDHCHGNMAEPGTKIETCSTCHGSGRVSKVQRTILGNVQMQGVCDTCQGEGKTYKEKCKKCGGQGVISGQEELRIKIPAGIDDGEAIRLSGKGEAGSRGASAGDLLVVVRVENDRRWSREGNSIYSNIEISFAQAALGDKIDVETVDGKLSLKIPPGTQSGTSFKLRGKGVSNLRGLGRGDHFVKVIVRTPTNLNRRQRKLLEEMDLKPGD
jgi:molecular chaperone DnaJ